MNIAKFFYARDKGCLPFVFGRDYTPDMPEEEVEYINKANILALEFKMKIIETVKEKIAIADRIKKRESEILN
jgi:hypothetical protein